jgi:uncharacterized membrane protein
MSESSSTLLGNLGVIILVWIAALVIAQVVKLAMLKSLAKAGEKARAAAEGRVRKGVTIFSVAATAVAAITLLIFLLFMNNARVKAPDQVDKIRQAPLPENFQAPSKEDVAKSNEAAETKKSEEARKEATEDNTKAMDESIELFRKTK